jgi:hypothetical protein
VRPAPKRLFRTKHRPADPRPWLPGVVAMALEHAVPGGFLELVILHDHDCPFPTRRGPCRCRDVPEVKLLNQHRREQAERN